MPLVPTHLEQLSQRVGFWKHRARLRHDRILARRQKMHGHQPPRLDVVTDDRLAVGLGQEPRGKQGDVDAVAIERQPAEGLRIRVRVTDVQDLPAPRDTTTRGSG